MCGRYSCHHTPEEIAEFFDVDDLLIPPTDPNRYNIAPTQSVAAITQNGTRHLEYYKWGLVPSWAKDPAIGSRMINARAETIAEKPAFRTALTRRRCLIPADGFFEWKDMTATLGSKAKKQPLYITRPDGGLFAFAGLWEEWHDPDGSPLRTCTIITVAANEFMSDIHDRMPAILTRDEQAHWLDKSPSSTADLLSLLRPSEEALIATPVSTLVNIPGNDAPECIEPLAQSA